MAHYILALDQGTTSSRSILFTRRGHVKASRPAENLMDFASCCGATAGRKGSRHD